MSWSIKLKTEHSKLKTDLKIGEVSRLSGVGVEALRFYERQGLLGRPARTASGYRVYDAATLERLEFIKRAQILGFSLAEIASIISERAAGHSPCARVREIVRQRLQALDDRLKEMQRYRKELAATLRDWESAEEVPGHICGLIEGATTEDQLADPLHPEKRRKTRQGEERGPK